MCQADAARRRRAMTSVRKPPPTSSEARPMGPMRFVPVRGNCGSGTGALLWPEPGSVGVTGTGGELAWSVTLIVTVSMLLPGSGSDEADVVLAVLLIGS